MLKRDGLRPAADSPNHPDNQAAPVFLPDGIQEAEMYQPHLPDEFLLPGLQQRGGVGAIVAPGATGKSFLLMSIAIGVAKGEPIAGGLFPAPKQGKVLYLAGEETRDTARKRLEAHGIPPELMQVLDVRPLHGRPGQERPYLLDAKGLPCGPWIDAILEAAEGAALVILDPLRRFHRSNENDTDHATQLVQVLEEIAGDNRAILVGHHANKFSGFNGLGGDQSAARGSTALTDAMRWQVGLVGMTVDEAANWGVAEKERGRWLRLALSTAKINNDEKGGDVWLSRGPGGVLSKDVPGTSEFRMEADPRKKTTGKKGCKENKPSGGSESAAPTQEAVKADEPPRDPKTGLLYVTSF